MDRWDNYFKKIAMDVSHNSRCMSQQIGAVIVRDNRFIVSTGYNGPPMGIAPCNHRFLDEAGRVYTDLRRTDLNCLRARHDFSSGEGLHLCAAAHAEQNAIAIAARLGVALDLCTMYLTCMIPCRECAKNIINAGIKEVVITDLVIYDKEGITGGILLTDAGVDIRTYK